MMLSGSLKILLEGFFQALISNQVEFLVIGGIAVNHHGYSRASNDIDLWYNPTIANFENVILALKEYGQDVSELSKLVFDSKKTFLRIPLDYFKIEMLPIIHGGMTSSEAKSEFRICFKRSEIGQLGKVEYRIIGYNDLIRFKKINGRPKDMLDVLELQRLKRGGKE